MDNGSTRQHGFTLSGVVVVVVAIGSLAAAAVPHLTETRRDARIETVEAMAAQLRRTVDSVHTACLVDPRCNVRHPSQFILIQGHYERVHHGWLDAAHAMANGEVDAWIHHNGFSAVQPDDSRARFTLDDAPAPDQCSVTYLDASAPGVSRGVRVSKSTDGC